MALYAPNCILSLMLSTPQRQNKPRPNKGNSVGISFLRRVAKGISET